jgi:hypothetical protein
LILPATENEGPLSQRPFLMSFREIRTRSVPV